MIKTIALKNFQSHADTIIELAPDGGLTVIVGSSDNGKSSTIRALKWLLYNQPQGDDFRRVGCDVVEVEIETTAGNIVTRRRTSSTNRYVTDHDVFEGFGSSVPLEVQQMTGVRSVRLGDQEIWANLAEQLAPPFLGSSVSGPARAKVLGKLAGTEAIDIATRQLGTDLYRQRQDQKRYAGELADQQSELARYDHLPMLAARIRRLKVLQSSIESAVSKRDRLQLVIAKLHHLRTIKSGAENVLRWTAGAEAAAAAIDQAAQSHVRRKRLGVATARLRIISNRKDQVALTLGATNGANAAGEAVDRAIDALSDILRLERLSTRHENVARDMCDAEETLSRTAGAGSAAPRLEDVAQAVNRHGRLASIAGRLSILQGRIAKGRTFIATVRPAAVIEPAHVDDMLAHRRRLWDLRTCRNACGIAQQQTQNRIDDANDAIEQHTQAYAEALSDAGVCPTCGQPVDVDHQHLKEVV